MAVNKVFNNNDLNKIIKSYVPLSSLELKRKKNIINELKYTFCEWSSHRDLCYICDSYHPLIINRYRPNLKMCKECVSIVNRILYVGINVPYTTMNS
jgi:hypothetical protein